jgi:hypothetical protein
MYVNLSTWESEDLGLGLGLGIITILSSPTDFASKPTKGTDLVFSLLAHIAPCSLQVPTLHSAKDDAVEAVHLLLAVGLVAVRVHQGEQVLPQLLLLLAAVAVLKISSPVRR